jgi:pyruvate ferredoxin oxidoreductase beta subunit
VFNNEIFGLTKGQTSPTSPMGHKSKTQPSGSAKAPIRPLSLSLAAGATYIARTAATNPRQAQEIVAEAIEHDGFAHVDFLTQCPTWNKDAKEYVPYTDVQESEEFDFDVTDRREAGDAMYEAETRLYEGEVLTGRFFRQDRPTYGEEKRSTGEMPDDPLAGRYFDEDAEWERAADTLVERHT